MASYGTSVYKCKQIAKTFKCNTNTSRPLEGLRHFSFPRSFSNVSDHAKEKHNIIFLGTPTFAADVLRDLFEDSLSPGSNFQISAVISRPTNKAHLSPVERVALDYGLPRSRLFCPTSITETSLLAPLRDLGPCSLAITAAYGALLPNAFLALPKYGTLNIHPSLLPKLRGAAPVQRSLESGSRITGASLVQTVLKCDAGPVLAQASVTVDPEVQAPELTDRLFRAGSRLLRQHLPEVLAGRAKAWPQDEQAVTFTKKLAKEECGLDFGRTSAWECHNKVRALRGWREARGRFVLLDM
eukprot:CAMPEP_0175074270 /NCGR_PEP_ID=MMETSP0052_2-20121109/21186_1 /TAXON_ID=51329 ORGANISM="Polytomella parva, Strain SAG 63-3" /NCGR_SAMPLE_ID=MMETSP0052_2 /ASSEMBLY_ACC=CAM_ASM_000194 /LENGTH=297 /DNA_ID=CAMNT_0016342495 /DNA_START=59 /DNA_END=949 /DNA_ORIENTATION=+